MKCRLHIPQTLATRVNRLREGVQSGMTTAEYAVGTLAACSQHTSQLTGVGRMMWVVSYPSRPRLEPLPQFSGHARSGARVTDEVRGRSRCRRMWRMAGRCGRSRS